MCLLASAWLLFTLDQYSSDGLSYWDDYDSEENSAYAHEMAAEHYCGDSG